ncbi:hypothetical protein [Devosia sp. FKR38]|uniref:hypothetical protein n=1 Tax=Devosia sp. FKR38 TaxID=2562312 RepID=UPI0010C02110|nr:hypothetical protein [Devosia sp. FKR38]
MISLKASASENPDRGTPGRLLFALALVTATAVLVVGYAPVARWLPLSYAVVYVSLLIAAIYVEHSFPTVPARPWLWRLFYVSPFILWVVEFIRVSERISAGAHQSSGAGLGFFLILVVVPASLLSLILGATIKHLAFDNKSDSNSAGLPRHSVD